MYKVLCTYERRKPTKITTPSNLRQVGKKMNSSPEPEFVKVKGAQESIPLGSFDWLNRFLGINSWAPQTFKIRAPNL